MKLRARLTYANVVSTLALIVAVSGGATAVAVSVNASKKSDITRKGKIKRGRVTTAKLADGAVTASKLADIHVVASSLSGVGALAPCPSGHRLIAGGGEASASSGSTLPPTLIGSRPQGNAWFARGGPNAVTYAICLSDTPGR